MQHTFPEEQRTKESLDKWNDIAVLSLAFHTQDESISS